MQTPNIINKIPMGSPMIVTDTAIPTNNTITPSPTANNLPNNMKIIPAKNQININGQKNK